MNPEDEQRFQRILFNVSYVPDPEFAVYVDRLHRLKQLRGTHREWTKDEKVMLNTMQAISFMMVNAWVLKDDILKRQLMFTLDSFFDALFTVVGNPK
jgi:hypothetical protein